MEMGQVEALEVMVGGGMVVFMPGKILERGPPLHPEQVVIHFQTEMLDPEEQEVELVQQEMEEEEQLGR